MSRGIRSKDVPEERPPVLCFGELLKVVRPTDDRPGGAPLNLAYHLHRLGVRAHLASAIACDESGAWILRQIEAWGLETTGIQTESRDPTGEALTWFSPTGELRHEIRPNAAWDRIVLSDVTRDVASRASALVFGSLAQRSLFNRHTLDWLLATIPSAALRVFDVNLRPPFDDLVRVRELTRRSSVLKLNALEAECLLNSRDGSDARLTDAGLCTVGNVERYARILSAELTEATICITMGAQGAGLLEGGAWYWQPARRVSAHDTRGAGDAFLAAFLAARLRRDPPDACLAQACRLAEWVVSHEGATPDYDANAPDGPS